MHIKYLMIHLTPEEFNKFLAALETAQPDTPKFDRLFSRESRFDEPKPE